VLTGGQHDNSELQLEAEILRQSRDVSGGGPIGIINMRQGLPYVPGLQLCQREALLILGAYPIVNYVCRNFQEEGRNIAGRG
jgi:hypothetical protein